MFEWFSPSCPCDPEAKKWLEARLGWLCREFPSNVFSDRGMVLPVTHFFPEPYFATREGLEGLVRQVCEYMDVPFARVEIELNHDPNKTWLVDDRGETVPHAAGVYERSAFGHVLTFDTDELASPGHLVATIAHELAHARLLGERRLRNVPFDNELLTDLCAFALGFGVFMANSPRVWTSQFSEWPGTRLVKPEYMTPPMYGYALGLVAWFDGDRDPQWAPFLGPGARTDFRQAKRFLFKTGDSSFRPRPRAVDEETPEDI